MKRRQGELPDKENLPERDKETASLGGLGQFFPRAIDIQANFPGSEDYGQARDTRLPPQEQPRIQVSAQ